MPIGVAYPILVIEVNDDIADTISRSASTSFVEAVLHRVANLEAAQARLESLEFRQPNLILCCGCEGHSPYNDLAVIEWLNMLPVAMAIPRLLLGYSTCLDHIRQTYDLGVTAYHSKPKTLADWCLFFHEIRAYWYEHVTPRPRM